MPQLIDKKMIKPEKKPTVSISNTKPKKSYTSKQTKPIRSSNLKTLSYSAIVESEIKNQQAFSSYSQLIRKTKLNRFKTRFDLFL
jgi:nucleoside diphosphate kinase